VKSLPAAAKTDAVYDVIAFPARGDRGRRHEPARRVGEPRRARARERPAARARRASTSPSQPKLLTARVRSELLSLVRALALRDYEEAARWVHADPADLWDAARFEAALAPFHAEYGAISFTPDARRAHHTSLRAGGPRRFDVTQVLVDANGDNLWALHGEVDLRQDREPELPLVRLVRIGT
jgi:hypothetical protein